METKQALKSLADLNPRPQPGQWYAVTPNPEGGIRTVILISDHPNVVITPWDTTMRSGIANFFEPQLVTKDEAKIHLEQEIKNMQKALGSNIKESEKPMFKRFIKNTEEFYKNHF
jgi:hypothetical protein